VLLNNPSATSKAISLPTSALRQESNKTMVWVLDPATMTVKSQEIQITTADGNDAVVNSGLQGGSASGGGWGACAVAWVKESRLFQPLLAPSHERPVRNQKGIQPVPLGAYAPQP
jgi:membrane fusion protein, multidrug efflux system